MICMHISITLHATLQVEVYENKIVIWKFWGAGGDKSDFLKSLWHPILSDPKGSSTPPFEGRNYLF